MSIRTVLVHICWLLDIFVYNVSFATLLRRVILLLSVVYILKLLLLGYNIKQNHSYFLCFFYFVEALSDNRGHSRYVFKRVVIENTSITTR